MLEIVLIWLALAFVVGVAANTRRRSGLGWFLLAIVVSPLIAGLLLLAVPQLKDSAEAKVDGPFTPDAVMAGTPYRFRDGVVEAMMSGGLVRFRSMDHFRAAVEGRDTPEPDKRFEDEVDGIPFTLEPEGTVVAMTPAGQRSYPSLGRIPHRSNQEKMVTTSF